MSGDAPRPRQPSEYRPDLRPMLVLFGLLVVIVLGWAVLGPVILPAPDGAGDTTGLEGRWTRTPDDPLATSLAIDADGYELGGEVTFTGAGYAARDGDQLVLGGDPACPDAEGRYSVVLGDVDRFGLLPENRAQTMTLTVIDEPCDARAEAMAVTWTLRASGRDGVHGICDPPNEEAAITGHWPEPSGCAAVGG